MNISFDDELLRRIDELAKQESHSRSELIREAARAYIERSNRWKKMFDFAGKLATERKISEEDIR